MAWASGVRYRLLTDRDRGRGLNDASGSEGAVVRALADSQTRKWIDKKTKSHGDGTRKHNHRQGQAVPG